MTVCIDLRDVSIVRDDAVLLHDINWQVDSGQRWAVLGPNGSGKTTTLQIAGAQIHPSSGSAHVLGHRLGRVDVRSLRTRIAHVSGAVTRQIPDHLEAAAVVVTGFDSTLSPQWDRYDAAVFERVGEVMNQLDLVDIAERPFSVISEGERQRTLLARALMGRPDLMLLDEPFAGLDMGAREGLLTRLTDVFADASVGAAVLVTHHVEEIPVGTTHVALLSNGTFVGSGPIASTLTSAALSDTFGLKVELDSSGGRYWARAVS